TEARTKSAGEPKSGRPAHRCVFSSDHCRKSGRRGGAASRIPDDSRPKRSNEAGCSGLAAERALQKQKTVEKGQSQLQNQQ
ncbi:MAG: hypothetical protein R6V85_09370, partial [Polyangia bacterium]